MRGLGFKAMTEDEEAIPWRESRHYSDPEKRPGLLLSGARFREGLTQDKLAERTGIPRRHISEMENGRRPIGKSNAKKLAEALNIDPRRLLTL
jgi:plasmid maintenance system antidote protein VapI